MTTAARFVDGDPVTHAIAENHYFHGLTRCGLRVEWIVNKSGLEPRGRRFGCRAEGPIDCMTCLARE